METDSVEAMQAELEELRRRLQEAEQALEAIRKGEVESLVIEGPNGPRIFSKQGLRESEQRYRLLFEATPCGVVVLDLEGRILEFNEEAHCQLGYTREEFAGLTVADLEGAETPDEVQTRGARIAEKRNEQFETKHRTKSGGVRDVLVSSCVVEIGGAKCRLSVWRDITDRKRTEQGLLEADRNKNQFLAMLSHELRSPLTPIKNSLFVLDRAAPGGEQARRAQRVIDRQVGHLCRLIDDLLDLTRISRGKMQLRPEVADLRDILRRTIEDHRPAFDAAGVALEITVALEPFPVHADGTRLAQMIGNLLHNAGKFTPRGGRASVILERDAGTNQAVLRVRDTGVGIAPEMLSRLFEPFAQADDTLDRSHGGLGLGLSLVRRLAEIHGGYVSATSDGPNQGAEFVLRLPLGTALRSSRTSTATRENRVRSRRVLIIEDNIDSADSLREVLELGGHVVETAHTGTEGLEKAHGFVPEVVFCDVGLPRINGYQVVKAMRADPSLCDTYLIALSGYAAPEDVAAAKSAGFDRHLAKPPSIEQIEGVLGETPQRSGGAGDPAGAVSRSDTPSQKQPENSSDGS